MLQPKLLQPDAEVEPGEPVLRANADRVPERVRRLLQAVLARECDAEVVPRRVERRVFPDRGPIGVQGTVGFPRPFQRQSQGLEEDRAQPVCLQRPRSRLDGTGCVSEPHLDERLVVVEHLRPPPDGSCSHLLEVPRALASCRVVLHCRLVPVLPQVRVAHLQAGAVGEVGGPGVMREAVHTRRDLVAFDQRRERLGVPPCLLERRALLSKAVASAVDQVPLCSRASRAAFAKNSAARS